MDAVTYPNPAVEQYLQEHFIPVQVNVAETPEVMERFNTPWTPTLIVLDATTGQNGLAQAEQFRKAVGVSGIALTKMDGTAKGGIVFAIAQRLGIPLRYIGVGEQAEDLRVFDAGEFVDALLDRGAAQ